MLSISKRGMEMPESPIRKLVPYAEHAKKRGTKVYHLNIGQPDIKTPDIALNAIRNSDIKVVEYSHSAGNITYRQKLAKYYQNINIHVDEDDILITTGGSEAITFAFLSCLNPGDEVIIPEPFYANYNGFAVSAGVKVVPITSKIEDGFALPPIEEFNKLINEKTKGIVICNPNNPTGYLYSEDELRKLNHIIKENNLYLFSDEVYREFCYDGEKHFSAMYLEDIENNVILMDSVSKRYSECGVRIGAMITKNKEVIRTALKFAQARLSPPSYGQIVGEASLDTPPEYFEEVYNEYIDRRNFLVEKLREIPGVVCPMPKGAFYAVVKLPIDDADKFAQWLLEDFEHNGETIMVAPATGFYSTEGLGKQEIRIAYVLKKEDLGKAVECLAEALKVYPGIV